MYLADKLGGRLWDANAVRNARALADAHGLSERVRFEAVDASQPMLSSFEGESFDAIVSNDAMCHIANRAAVYPDWHRIRDLAGARSSDAMIVEGPPA